MKHSLSAVAALGTLAMLSPSCTQDEMVLQSHDEIRVSVATASHSRAAESFCNLTLPSEISLWAQTADTKTPYFSNVSVSRRSSGEYEFSDGNNRYWPKEGNLNFLAYHGDENSFNNNFDDPQFVDFKVHDNPFRQTDLIYAVNSNVAKTTDAIPLNFRHALSQIVFSARVSNENLCVEIDSVTIGHIHNQGTFSFSSSANTGNNWIDNNHSDSPATPTDDNNNSGWTNLSGNATYSVKAASSEIRFSEEGEAVRLTYLADHSETQTPQADVREILNLIPQQQEEWVPIPGAAFNGSYIAVKCRIFSVEGEDKTLLNPNQNWTYIPVTINWQPGIRYVYTLDFGHGNAGYASPFEGGSETLTPIDLQVSADDLFNQHDPKANAFKATFIIPDGMSRWDGIETWYHYGPETSYQLTMPSAPTIPNDDFIPYEECMFGGWATIDCFNEDGIMAIYSTDGKLIQQAHGIYPGEDAPLGVPGSYRFVAGWEYKFRFRIDYHLEDFYGLSGIKFSENILGKVTLNHASPYDIAADSIYVGLSNVITNTDNPEFSHRAPTGYQLIGFSSTYKPYVGQNLSEDDCDWICSEPITLDNDPFAPGNKKGSIRAKITLPWGKEARGNYTLHAIWSPIPDAADTDMPE